MSVFSERLNEAARIRGVNQAWIAAETNTSSANISRYFTGQQSPLALEIVAKIAKVLNVTTDFLLGVSDSPYSQTTVGQIDSMLVSCYARATASDKKVLWALLSKYAFDSETELLNPSVKKEMGLE